MGAADELQLKAEAAAQELQWETPWLRLVARQYIIFVSQGLRVHLLRQQSQCLQPHPVNHAELEERTGVEQLAQLELDCACRVLVGACGLLDAVEPGQNGAGYGLRVQERFELFGGP